MAREKLNLKRSNIGVADMGVRKKQLNNEGIVNEKVSGSENKRFLNRLAFVLFAISFLVFANTLKNGFALDDIEVLQKNNYVIKGFAGIPEILSTPHLRGFMITPNETYRPLSLVAFAIEYGIWGENAFMGHLMNLLWFGLGIVLLFRFLQKVMGEGSQWVAFIATLIFAVHPIHTEVVANIKSRDELMCFAFAMFASLKFIDYCASKNLKSLIVGAVASLLAFLSKETVITYMAVLPLVLYFVSGDRKSKAISYVSFLVTAGIFIGLRTIVLHAYNNEIAPVHLMDNSLAGAPNAASKFATIFLILGKYLKLTIFPFPLCSDYSFASIPFVTFSDPMVWVSLVLVVAIAALAVIRLIKHGKDFWAFGILFYAATLALFSNVFFLLNTALSERFLFFPTVGFALVVALAINKWLVNASLASFSNVFNFRVLLVLGPVVCFYSIVTIARNSDWFDSETLFEADIQKVPQNACLNYCVGYHYVSTKYEQAPPQERAAILDEGIKFLQKSVLIAPTYANAQTELGHAFFTKAMYDSAEVHTSMALKINPNASDAVNNMAGIYFVKGDYKNALVTCRKALEIRPNYAQAYYNIGLCHNFMKSYDSSITYLKRALQLDPGFKKSHSILANNYKNLNQPDSMKKYELLASR